MAKKSKEFYEFQKKLKHLKHLRGQGTELISVYIPPGYNVNLVSNQLRDEYGQASNIKSKQTRKNVQSAIERITHLLKGVNKPPEHGIAIFCGNIDGRIELYTIEPPEPIKIQTYRCDSTFLISPLEEYLEIKNYYGIVVMDRREATIAIMKGKSTNIIKKLESDVPGKHHKGGQSAPRFQRQIEQQVGWFYKEVAEAINEIFSDPKIKSVIVGGSGPTKYEFASSDYIHNNIKDKIIGYIDTGYTDEFGIQEVVHKSGELLEEEEASKERALVERFLKEISTNGLATYGIKEVEQALITGQVDTLLLSEQFDYYRVTKKCTNCGEVQELNVKGKQEADKIDTKCHKCNGNTENTIEELSDKFIGMADDINAEVEVISTETTEGKQFYDGFGGIGAFLRYK